MVKKKLGCASYFQPICVYLEEEHLLVFELLLQIQGVLLEDKISLISIE